jgi:hypothetical protein
MFERARRLLKMFQNGNRWDNTVQKYCYEFPVLRRAFAQPRPKSE